MITTWTSQKVEVQSGLYILGSKLGWILSGRTSEIVENSTGSSMLIMTHGKGIDNETTFLTCLDKSLPMKPNLVDFWKLESTGINDSPVESDNDVALKKFSETLKYDEGRYTVTWPEWKRASTDQEETEIQSQTESEFRKTKVLFEARLVAGEGSPELKEKRYNIDVERFSSFTKLCRATAWVIRFIEKLRKRTNLSSLLKSTEISKAETMWTAYVQQTEYSKS